MSARSGLLALLCALALLWFCNLGVRHLVKPDEGRYAEIPREMLELGDWINPHLAYVDYFEKPPLGHWLNAVSLAVFGENAFAVRLPAALATGLAALIVFGFARRFAGGLSRFQCADCWCWRGRIFILRVPIPSSARAAGTFSHWEKGGATGRSQLAQRLQIQIEHSLFFNALIAIHATQ